MRRLLCQRARRADRQGCLGGPDAGVVRQDPRWFCRGQSTRGRLANRPHRLVAGWRHHDIAGLEAARQPGYVGTRARQWRHTQRIACLVAQRVGQTGGDAAGDTFSGIENVSGSNADDVITGSAGANVLNGTDKHCKFWTNKFREMTAAPSAAAQAAGEISSNAEIEARRAAREARRRR